MLQITVTTPPGCVRVYTSMDDPVARQRKAAELIVSRIERNLALRRLQSQAIQRADRRRFHRALIRNGALFILAAVSIFALIWWCGL